MLKALIQQQFPRLEVEGINDTSNTGNFVVRTSEGVTIWPYGFVTTSSRQRDVLKKIAQQFGYDTPV